MAPEYSDEQVAETFKKLNMAHGHSRNSRLGIYASWAALALLSVCFFLVAVYVIDADRRAESVRLQQSTDLVVQSMESHLLGTTELLQRTSMRLMHIPNNTRSHLASAEMAATGFMQDRREVRELRLVDRHFNVLRYWYSPTQSTEIPRKSYDAVKSPALRRNIDTVFFRDTSLVSKPYTLKGSSLVYVDVVIPTPVRDQVLVAQINFTRLINDAATGLGHGQYRFYIEDNGKPMPPTLHFDKDLTTGLSYATRIPILNAPEFRLVALSYQHQLFTTDNLKLWMIVALAGMLGLALTLLVRNQQKQHRAHQRLSAEYSLRVAMSESALAGIRVTDKKGKILFVNETFQKLVGYSSDELIGSSMPYRYWDEDVSNISRTILSHPNDHQVRTIEFQVLRKDGRHFDGQMNVSPLLNEHQRVIGWIGELYDITEQKRARERMKAAHERFTRVVQSMNSAICVITANTETPQLLFRNSPYENIFGRGVNGGIRLLHLLENTPVQVARSGIYDEESQRWFDARMQDITWTDDTDACMIIATDITVQRETELALEAQLRRAETTQRLVTMGEMASSLAHELNQPLAAISNYASGASMMINAGKLSREETIEALGKMSKQAQRAASIIKRIRGFAKKTDPQLTTVRAEAIVSETMELALIQAAKLKAEIKVNIAPDLPPMTGDAVMLEQLLLNLLKNAMEAVLPCPDHTIDLQVGLQADQPFIEFKVCDHGNGISDEDKAQLFDAFYSTKAEGMGMGLNICRSIVEVHHGRIHITDTPGGGATFTFTVPVARDSDNLM